jgi:hypothetical protein
VLIAIVKETNTTNICYIPYYGNKFRPNVVTFRPSCDKSHGIVDHIITSQLLANKTEARQWACSEWPANAGGVYCKRGTASVFIHIWSLGCLIRYTCTQQGIICMLANELRKQAHTREQRSFEVNTQRVLVLSYWRFRTTYRSHYRMFWNIVTKLPLLPV